MTEDVNLLDNQGKTALMHAAEQGNVEVVQYIDKRLAWFLYTFNHFFFHIYSTYYNTNMHHPQAGNQRNRQR